MAKERRRLINEDALSDVPTRNRAGRSTEEPGTSNEPHFVVVQGEEEVLIVQATVYCMCNSIPVFLAESS